VQNRFCLEVRREGEERGGREWGAQTMYAHVNKWIKKERKKERMKEK
jgi:hypothetical protein